MWTKIKNFFGMVFTYSKPIMKGAFNSVEPLVLEVAKQEALNLANSDLSSSKKRERAFKNVKTRVESQTGQQVKATLINYAIETAVRNIKNM